MSRNWWILAGALVIGTVLIAISTTCDGYISQGVRIGLGGTCPEYVTDGQGGYLLDDRRERIIMK